MANTAQCAGAQVQGTNGAQNTRGRTSPSRGYGSQSLNSNETNSAEQQLSQQGLSTNQALLATLPPEPLTELQKFVASTTGQILPIYGANLFRSVPSTFAPLDQTPVPSEYVLGPGDELRIRIWGQVNFQSVVIVDRQGQIYIPIPQVGPVQVAGLTYAQLDGQLRTAIGRVYRNFDLSADVGQIRAIQVYVSGEARLPGVYTVSSLSTLVDALFASGGPSALGSLRQIELRRGDKTVTEFDLYSFLVHGDKSHDVKLLSGDVIFIPPAGTQVAVTGSARRPAIYELRAGETLAGVLADAGGVSAIADEARISIERIDDHRERSAMEVAYDAEGLATPLADGDLVRVYSIVPKYAKTITLRGNTANPGRFAWHPGMHLSELIPDKQSLISRNYWWKRGQLGLPAPEFEPSADFADWRQPEDSYPVTMPNSAFATMSGANSGLTGQDQNGLLQNQSPNGQTTQDQLAQGQSSQNPSSQSQTSQNQNGAQTGQSESQKNATQTTAVRAGSSTLASAQNTRTARFGLGAPRTQIGPIAPEIDWNYAVIERLDQITLKTVLIPFDLGKLILQHDASQDFELQPGDVVSILSEADIRVPIAQQTKLVRLEGEFEHAGLYTVQPGETLRQLVERAGGLTHDAYLYGSEFTRESTRVAQQGRIDEYAQSLENEIVRGNIALASAGASSALSAEHDLLADVRQIRATGRIVLQFKPDSQGLSSIADISLEDGDSFVVPPVPLTVNVVGAVYDQNSFLYKDGRRVGGYLRLAGGATKDADQRREFIVRADGSVVSRGTGQDLWARGFNDLHLNPGDTIVVPAKTFKPSALKDILSWSQAFSQLAFGAAAISVLR
jgi:protein involved in polysaccharide export with SLBB domain